MPIFVYYCKRCSKHGEWIERFEEEGRECPWCDEPMERVPAIPAKTRVGRYGKAGGLAENSTPNLRNGDGA